MHTYLNIYTYKVEAWGRKNSPLPVRSRCWFSLHGLPWTPSDHDVHQIKFYKIRVCLRSQSSRLTSFVQKEKLFRPNIPKKDFSDFWNLSLHKNQRNSQSFFEISVHTNFTVFLNPDFCFSNRWQQFWIIVFRLNSFRYNLMIERCLSEAAGLSAIKTLFLLNFDVNLRHDDPWTLFFFLQ